MKRVCYVTISDVVGNGPQDSVPVRPGRAGEVIVSFYGVRGGFRSSENLTVAQAKTLRDGLNEAIAELGGTP